MRVPFDVPAGTTAVRVKYCFDQPEAPLPNVRHTLDVFARRVSARAVHSEVRDRGGAPAPKR